MELLVVIGIIAVLIGILLPAMNRARSQAKSVQCMSNLRQCGVFFQTYINDSRGWLFPVGPEMDTQEPDPVTGKMVTVKDWETLGSNVYPNDRWPMHVAGMVPHPPAAVPWPASWTNTPFNDAYTAPYTPAILRCPADEDPMESHSYVLNSHIVYQEIKSGQHYLGGLSTPDIVVMGEKQTPVADYFMEYKDFDRVVEQYRHGVKLGSNYLKMDWHVDTLPPNVALAGTDPWDVPVATTQPTS